MPDSPRSDFTDDDLHAALDALSEDPNWARAGVAQRARARRRNRWVTAAGVALAVMVGAVGVVAVDDKDRDEVPIVAGTTDEPTTTTVLATGAHIEIWPRVIDAGFPTELTAVLMNDSDEVASFCVPPDQVVVDGATLAYPVQLGAACAPAISEFVLPGEFSHQWTIGVPALDPGEYSLDGVSLVASPTDPAELLVEVQADHTITLAGSEDLIAPTMQVPDEIVVLGGNRLAIRWTGDCNEPAYDVQLHYAGSAWGWTDVEVKLRTASFFTRDCVGEPSNWSAVVDLPEPLGRAEVWASTDGAPGVEPVNVPIRYVDAWPMGEPNPALVTMDREPLSILGASAAPGWVSLRPFDGCGAWVARPIVDNTTMYVQAYVPADNEACVNGPTPTLGFSAAADTTYQIFGGI